MITVLGKDFKKLSVIENQHLPFIDLFFKK